jgi:hypothetical protein
VVSPRFVSSSVRAAFYAHRGHRGITFQNCTFRTRFAAWNRAWRNPALPDPMLDVFAGLRLAATQDLRIDGLHIEGFPEAAIDCQAIDRAKLQRISIARCLVGLNMGPPGSRNWELDNLRVWGPGPNVIPGFGGSPSHRHPGGFTGGDGFAAYLLDDSVLRSMEFTGDLYTGIKLARCKRVFFFNVVTPLLMVQGTQQRNQNNDGTTDGAEDIQIRSLHLDKGLGGSDASDEANGMQVSWNVRGLDVRDFALIASGKNGHGVQLWGDVSAVFRDGLFSGWNGTRGGQPAYALELGDGSTVNDDFEVANRFENQLRRVLRRK